jgi:hypothetical protein
MIRRIGYNLGQMNRVRLLRFAVAASLMTTAVLAHAQTRPATAPATAPADASTPKGALKALAQALDAGDRKAVLELLWAQSPSEQKTANATADLAEAAAGLRRAAAKAFGDEAARPLGVEVGATPQALDRIDAARVHLDGERATVRTENAEGPPMVLARSNGVWRVPVGELSKDVEPADVERTVSALASQAKLLRELTAEVAAGKYKTAADARQALDKRIVQSAFPQSGPSTAATKPSGT